MWSDRRRGWSTAALLAAAPALLASCRDSSPAPTLAERAPRRLRVIAPRETPRSPFRLALEGVMLGPTTCELRLVLRSAGGGAAIVEFHLPEGVTAGRDGLRRECPLEAGLAREERLTVEVPEQGHLLLGAAVEMDGHRAEAYLELGEPPGAPERGLRVRSSAQGQPVLRIGPEDLAR